MYTEDCKGDLTTRAPLGIGTCDGGINETAFDITYTYHYELQTGVTCFVYNVRVLFGDNFNCYNGQSLNLKNWIIGLPFQCYGYENIDDTYLVFFVFVFCVFLVFVCIFILFMLCLVFGFFF